MRRDGWDMRSRRVRARRARQRGACCSTPASPLSHGMALKHRVVPLGVHRGMLAVATTNPIDPALERELAAAAKQRVRLHPAGPAQITRAQVIVYGTGYGATVGSELKYPTRNPDPLA